MHSWKKPLVLIATAFGALVWLTTTACQAAPPVRIAIVPGGGSGMEQSIVDGITGNLQDKPNIVISTVNPDWYVVCNIVEQPDTVGSSIKVNGTVTIKTTDGQVLNTVAVQTNKQDYSLQPGAPLNKALVESAVREVIAGITERATNPIEDAVNIEIATRDKIIAAESLAGNDKYDEAISILSQISPDTPHFKAVRVRINEFQMEKQALEAVKKSEELAKHQQFTPAIKVLKDVNLKSKRYKLAQERISTYRAAIARLARLAKLKHAGPAKSSSGNVEKQVNALEAQKGALEAQKKAIDAQEAALKSQPKH